MHYLTKVAALCLLTTLSITSYAQTLKAAMSNETTSNVKFLNLESEKYFVPDAEYPEDAAMRFDFAAQSVVMKDVDSDGVQDAVALLYYCEETNCHATTRSVDLVVFKGLGKNQFTKLGSIPLGVDAKIKSISKGVIKVTSYGYGEDDPSCCPTDELAMSYKIKNKKLVKLD